MKISPKSRALTPLDSCSYMFIQGISLGRNSHSMGRNFTLNGTQGEVGVSLLFRGTHFHSVTTQTQAVVTAYTLGTNFVLLCRFYYLLYDIDIFTDYSFILEATVLLLSSKISLINAVKLIVKISQ